MALCPFMFVASICIGYHSNRLFISSDKSFVLIRTYLIFANMKILTANQLKQLDAFTIEHEPIKSIDLMERAAQALSLAIQRRWSPDKSIKIMAGPGGNGGDALAVARILSQSGYKTETFLFNTSGKLSENCAINKQRLEQTPGAIINEITSQFAPPQLTRDDLVVDGLFGIGLRSPLNRGFASLVTYINSSPATIVSIDVPSGLMCEDNSSNNTSHIIRAHVTLTIGLPKLAFLLSDNAPYIGEVEVLDIGLSREGYEQIPQQYYLTELDDAKNWILPRNSFGHKGSFGHALLIAGQYGMAGASVLAARACLRCGVGKLTVHAPSRNNDILQICIPEAIVHADTDEYHFTEAEIDSDYQALAIGPGIGKDSKTEEAFIKQVRNTSVPLIIDADGLNILSHHRDWLRQIPAGTILTPHPGEWQRLTGSKSNAFTSLEQAREMAIHHQFFIVLKGHYTATCTPSGQIYFNPTGNSGMATAGSGDVLTGILLGLLAQGYQPETACRLGTFIHGLAGDLAAQDLGEHSLTAGDIITFLPKAFLKLIH